MHRQFRHLTAIILIMNHLSTLLQVGINPIADILQNVLIILGILLVLYLFVVRSENIGNWCVLYPNMNYDPEEYYQKVVDILVKHEVPNFHSRHRTFEQGSMISSQRLYLEVSRGEYIYHICGAPWGTDFFFSWWQRKRYSPIERLFVKIPVIGPVIKAMNETATYYKLDTDAAFNASVRHAVQEAINDITDAKGLRRLTESEWVPDMRSAIK